MGPLAAYGDKKNKQIYISTKLQRARNKSRKSNKNEPKI